MEVTKKLSEYVVSARYEEIPQPVVKRAKELILDCVGSALAGSLTGAGKLMTDYAREANAAPEATLIGGGFQTALPYALYANGTLAHVLELENVTNKGGPNALHTIIAALALGEKLRLSGKAIIEGFVIGYEAQSAIADACPGAPGQGWQTGSLFGTIGCAALGARMLGLNVDKTRMAIGIATSQPSGLFQQVGTITHFIEFGMACRNGVESALLAAKGVNAVKDAIENPAGGFCNVYLWPDSFDFQKMVDSLGKYSFIVSPTGQSVVSVKKYPCCYRNHRFLDAILQLIREQNISYDDVSEIQIDVNRYTPVPLRYSDPKDVGEARFSLQYNIAAAILDKKIDLDTFTDKKYRLLKSQSAMRKIKVIVHPEWPTDRTYTREPITVRMKDGRTFSREPHAVTELTEAEESAKYQSCAGSVLSSPQSEHLRDLILNLDQLENLNEVAGLLRTKRS